MGKIEDLENEILHTQKKDVVTMLMVFVWDFTIREKTGDKFEDVSPLIKTEEF